MAVIGRTLGSSTWVTRKVVLKVAGQTKWRTRAVTLRTRNTTWRTRATISPSSRSAIWNTRFRVIDTNGATTWVTFDETVSARRTLWGADRLADPAKPNIRLRAYAPNGNHLGILPTPQSVDVSYVMDDVGALTLTYSPHAPNAGLLGQPLEIAVEMSTNGGVTFWEPTNSRFVYVADERDQADPQGNWTSTCKSYIWRLDKARVWTSNAGKTLTNSDGRREFIGVTVGTILLTLLGEARSRGALFGIGWGFSTVHDTAGVAWADTLIAYYDPGMSYLDLLKDLQTRGFLNFRMMGRVLQVFGETPSNVMATDRTVGNSQMALRLGRDVREQNLQRTWEGLADTVLLAGGDEKHWSVIYTNAAAVKPWGRQEAYVSDSSVFDDLGANAKLAQLTATQTNDQRSSYTWGLDFSRAVALPMENYGLGDYIWAVTDTTTAPLRMRVRQVTISVDATGKTVGNVVLNDKFAETDIRTTRALNRIANGSIIGGSAGDGKGGPAVQRPSKLPPAKVGSVTASSSVYLNSSGHPVALVILAWPAVTTNNNNTFADDIDHYEIYRRPFGSASTPVRYIGRSDDTVQDFSGYAPGSGWWFSVLAVDNDGNKGARSNEVGITMARKDTPPQSPSTPTTNVKITVVDVLWNGLPAFGSWPADFDYVEVHCSTVTGFTPTTATFIGRLYDAGNQVMSTGAPGVPLYFKLIAVDTSGNKSIPSGEAAGTPNLLLGPEFAAGQITYAQIGFKDPGNVVIDGSFETQQFQDLVASRSDAAWSFTTADAYHRTTSATADATVNPATFRTLWLVAQEDAQQIRPGEKLFLRGAYKRSGSDGSMWLVIQWIPSFTTSILTLGTVDGVWHVVSGQFAAPAGTEQFACYAQISTAATTGDVYLDAVEVRRTVATAIIEDAAITNALISNLAVDDAKIANLDVGKILAGTVVSDLLIAATLKTATSGSRVELSSTGLRMYNGTTLTFELDPTNAQARFYKTGDVAVNSTGHALQVGATNGWNVIMDDNEIMARDNGAVNLFNINCSHTKGPVDISDAIRVGWVGTSPAIMTAADDAVAGGIDEALQFTNLDEIRVTNAAVNSYQTIRASAFTVSSTLAVKQAVSSFDPLPIIRGAHSHKWRYRPEHALDRYWHFGPMTEDLPPELNHGPEGEPALDAHSMAGVLWEAVRVLLARVEVLERGAQP